MNKPHVSVMMPAYNAQAFVGEAIESVLAQTFVDWELIVVDDGSTDGTSDAIARYQDPRIRVLRQPNGGESAARNTALQHMRGALVAFLDADDIFLPEHLALTTAFLQANPQYHAVYTDGYYCNHRGERLQPLSAERRGPFTGDIFEEVVRASDVFGPPTCVVLRRALVEQHELEFDPQIVIGPDWDFMTRYSQWAQFGYVDARTCLYRVHQTNVTLRVDRQRRALYLARCRQKAIQLPRFGSCSLQTRRDVFYDLLVVHLSDHPQRQDEITAWPQFLALPAALRAQLLRLMAAQALLAESAAPEHARRWLQQARRLHPADWRSALLLTLHRLSAPLARRFLRVRRVRQHGLPATSPFKNLH